MLASDKEAGPELELTLAGLRGLRRARRAARRRGADPPQGRADRAPRRGDVGGRARARRAPARRGRAAELLDAGAVRELEPRLTGELHGASCFPRRPPVRPRAITRALAREAAEAGAEVRTGCAVEAIEPRGGRGVRTATARSARRGRAGRGRVERASWRAAPASSCRSSRAGASSCGSPRRSRAGSGTRSSTAPTWRRSSARRPGSQVTTVLETTWEGDVLVGSSRARRGFDTRGRAGGERGDARPRGDARCPTCAPCRSRRRGRACGRGCPTTCPRSGRRAPCRDCGSRPATRAPASRSARSPAGSSRRRCAASGRSLDLAPFDPDRFAAQ